MLRTMLFGGNDVSPTASARFADDSASAPPAGNGAEENLPTGLSPDDRPRGSADSTLAVSLTTCQGSLAAWASQRPLGAKGAKCSLLIEIKASSVKRMPAAPISASWSLTFPAYRNQSSTRAAVPTSQRT